MRPDFKGRITAAIDPLTNRKEYQYDVNGNLLKITQGASETSLFYDSSNRLETVTDPEGNTTAYEYASAAACSSCGGNADTPQKITDPLGNITKNIFDKAGRVNSIIDPMGKFSLLARDATGRVTSQTDANGKITLYQYDALGRLVKQTDANNGETVFTYDGLGNIKTLKDAKGNITTFAYDLAGRKTKETRPMGQTEEYTYYPNGLLKTVKDAKGQISTFTYDAANRLTQITYADGKTDGFTYDAVGNMLTYSKEGVNGSYAYDELNRKTSETVNYGPFAKTYSYTYDNFSNKATFTTPEGKVYNYAYNRNNQPTAIAFDGKTIAFTYQWNRRKKVVLPNGVTTDYTYNANSWLTSITAGTVLTNQNTYDNVGNITQKTTENDSIAYAYDPIYQLTQATGSVLPPETFAYDKIGNRQSAAEGADTTTYIHNANNELISANGVNYIYDANGNLISKTAGIQVTAYIYNSANRLINVQLPDGRTATYAYDPFGRRIKKEINGNITYYIYSDEGLIGEYDATGTLKKAYGWMPDMVWGTAPVFMEENGQYYYYHNDHLGTPRKMTDSTGAVVWSADYTAFGKATVDVSSTVINNLRFPGQYFDEETGLCYNLNRYYDPGTGRYISTDPIGFGGNDSNLYRFVLNNPLYWVDPEGLNTMVMTPEGPIYFPGPVTTPSPVELTPGQVEDMKRDLRRWLTPWPFYVFKYLLLKRDLEKKELCKKAQGDEVEIDNGFLDGDDVSEAGDHARDVGEVTGVVDRQGAEDRRRENLKGSPVVKGKDRDEYPPAVIKPDNPSQVSVRPINRSHNRRSGGRLKNRIPPDGTRVRIVPPK